MSEAMTIPPLADAPAKRTPTVYFIDDSATMREVIKIAFRRESINIIACADAAAALAQFPQNPPDAVITDVIMPDQDGYSVCTQIKQHAEYGSIPVILMSGVVNKTVADKAIAVKADELIRKPFQPQELISRVKSLLGPKIAALPAPERHVGASSLQTLFAPPAPPPQALPASPPLQAVPLAMQPSHTASAPPENVWPRALAEAFTPKPTAPATPTAQGFRAPAASPDIMKLKTEIARLELLVKKLQTELQIERQYNQALDQHIHNLTTTE
ncbi:MAG: putative Response regulator [Candidatus Acidoferrum typicum]|nr:putative Response regulator [Candidatus Acidoferrum typicum]